MNNVSKISYLIALYNKEDFIVEAVESVLDDQGAGYELEVCIVDDGSTDDSLRRVRERFSGLPNVKIDSFPKNKGKNAAYNRAFEMSEGQFISLLGADDCVVKGRSGFLLDECVRSGRAVYGGYLKMVEGRLNEEVVMPPRKPCFYKNIIGNTLSGGCFMAPKPLLESVFPIPECLQFEDWWLSYYLLRSRQVVTLPRPVLIYRIHGSNDCGVEEVTQGTIQKDYERHVLYLEMFLERALRRKERLYLKRSQALRKSFLYNQRGLNIFFPPYDASWVKLAIINLVGPGVFVKLGDIKRRKLKKV